MKIEGLYAKQISKLKKGKFIYGSSYFVIEDNKLYVMRRMDRSKSIFMIEKEKTIKLHAFRLKLRKYYRDYGYTKEGIVFLYLNYLFVFRYFSERVYEIMESYSLKKEKTYRDKAFLFYKCDAYKLIYPRLTHKTSQKTIDEIIRLREEKNWGPNKIEAYLKNKQDKVPPVGHNTIYRVICNAGLNNALERKRRTWGKKRFERKHSNSLWQADFKLTEEDLWMISYLDDHSRFITGSEKFNDPTTKNALDVLETSIDKYGRPKQILTDRGTQFYPARKKENKETMSRFTKYCKDLDIEHIVASKRRPTTIGKVEAFHKAYVFEAWMFDEHKDFVYYWNYERPHQGINYMYPAEIYFKDLNRTDVMG